MADQNTYVFQAKDGTPLSFVGERPPTSEEIEQLGGVAPKPESESQSTVGGLTLAALSKMTPLAAQAAMKFGASPTAAATASTLARSATTLGAVAQGALTLNPAQVLAASKEGWAAGKGAYWLTKGAQEVAKPASAILEKAGPVLGAASGVLGAVDLAAMAHGNRPGHSLIGKNLEPMSDAQALGVLQDSVSKGANVASVAAMLAKGDPKKFGALMTAYMQSRQAMPQQAQQPALTPDPNNVRADGSQKGTGFLGVLQRPDGRVSSEISIGVNIGGKEVEIPTLVPTLNQQEKQWLIMNDVSDPKKIPQSIIQKAVDFARTRMSAGKSPFAQPGEGPKP